MANIEEILRNVDEETLLEFLKQNAKPKNSTTEQKVESTLEKMAWGTALLISGTALVGVVWALVPYSLSDLLNYCVSVLIPAVLVLAGFGLVGWGTIDIARGLLRSESFMDRVARHLANETNNEQRSTS